MKLEKWKKGVRVAGGLGIGALVVAIFVGLARGSRQERGRKSGAAPEVMHTLQFYVPASAFGLALTWWLWRPLPVTLSRTARMAALLVGTPLYFAGLALMFWGRFTLGKNYDVTSALGAQLFADHELVTAGPFAYVRHPMYLGGILWGLGTGLIYRTWVALLIALGMPISLPLRARREEEALAAEFGEAWEAYRQRVPAIVPRLNVRSRHST